MKPAAATSNDDVGKCLNHRVQPMSQTDLLSLRCPGFEVSYTQTAMLEISAMLVLLGMSSPGGGGPHIHTQVCKCMRSHRAVCNIAQSSSLWESGFIGGGAPPMQKYRGCALLCLPSLKQIVFAPGSEHSAGLAAALQMFTSTGANAAAANGPGYALPVALITSSGLMCFMACRPNPCKPKRSAG